ncbi:hypothetical protein P7K49_038396 [Saguinus oedipus]|uniref:SKP1 component dimerisation domain-containing protein n=1 Tax=Saguinus oedipus TaxID=9490 RepID=A0ABQ9TEW0_SAGOE|nr:hypothetical protein P7K49_038396 [Saguinus oedipus]
MIKGKTPEEIRKTFNIKNDFTEEEEAQMVTGDGVHPTMQPVSTVNRKQANLDNASPTQGRHVSLGV